MAIAGTWEHTSLSNDDAVGSKLFPPMPRDIKDAGNMFSTVLAFAYIALIASAVGEAERPENLRYSKT